ncbi:HlyD family efflux transporter periplasmic adaptor subunit [Roseimaritima ulvae]|uniref:HlyD family secretion protein n=1 Tax=Roseimaritima ulvae TaxID=980254 RepID=A0A5B9R7X6_9BACT|nr:HlyD family efflux transporter periplasmic adaptor subunit [Roseimaritima ulvae]QEG42831.1 HlyD family secretion protein [Roseimaritima ulvae]
MQAADEIQHAAGPLSLIARIVRLIDQPDSAAERLPHACQEIAAATAATLVALRETPSQSPHLAGTEATAGDDSDGLAKLESLFASLTAQPSARSVDFAPHGSRRVLGCRSADGRLSLLVVLDAPPALASEAAWLRGLELVLNQLTAANRSLVEPSSLATFDFSDFHRSLDIRQVCSAIANDTRLLLQVDRVSVLLRRGRRFKTLAVSGVSKVHRRSNLIRTLEQLGRVIAATGETFSHPSDDELPPQIQAAWDDYVDQSLVDRLRIVPLFAPRDDSQQQPSDQPETDDRGVQAHRRPTPLLGLLVIEQLFDDRSADDHRSAPIRDHRAVVRHAAVAIENAERHRRIFLLPLWSLLGSAVDRSRRIWTALVLLVLASVVAALTFIQVDHYVVATGTLQPQQRQHVYAPHDGVVQTVHVQHGQRVGVEAPLVTLQSAELERQTEQILGQIQTVGRRLSAVRSTRRSRTLSANNTDSPFDSLAGEEQQLQAELASLETQHALLKRQLQQLQIRSPLAGQIVSWDLHQRIGSRPVSRGHELLTIADIDGPWVLEMELADQDIGTVRRAQQHGRTELPLQYALATAPEQLYPASLSRVAEASHRNADGQTVVELEAALAGDAAHALRVGARVRAKIYCGRRSAGASWFSDVARAFRKHVLFHFQRTKP